MHDTDLDVSGDDGDELVDKCMESALRNHIDHFMSKHFPKSIAWQNKKMLGDIESLTATIKDNIRKIDSLENYDQVLECEDDSVDMTKIRLRHTFNTILEEVAASLQHMEEIPDATSAGVVISDLPTLQIGFNENLPPRKKEAHKKFKDKYNTVMEVSLLIAAAVEIIQTQEHVQTTESLQSELVCESIFRPILDELSEKFMRRSAPN